MGDKTTQAVEKEGFALKEHATGGGSPFLL